ncbi:alginate lyase family protein [Pedobacter paludis]|uniref:Alginate lyase domain-containing protein n=1 Tax=Pedobacter paludis TaxID=2203212 RepID=A0A317EYU8_9SPHI|nr:alginate lyase family protein [Pedobacter paludis]PWS30408.1 hypothetical protein DF947_18465 [Pedobacter paludis]
MKKQKFHPVALLMVLMLNLIYTGCSKDQLNQQSAEQQLTITKESASPALGLAVTFVHPGILNTKSSLDIIASQANGNDQARLSAYQNLLNYCNQHSPSNNYKANVGVAGGVVTADETSFKGDALLAYALALRWAKTGTASYAAAAKQILNGWASAFRTIYVQSGSEGRQPALEAAWAAPTFTAAAEILKYYTPVGGQPASWSASENTQFVTFLNRLKNQYINNIVGYNINNNWTVSAGYAKMAIGIFIDDQAVYQDGMNIIKNVLPIVIKDDGAMPGEICGGGHNDCVHFQYALTGFSYAANLAAIQGDISIYTASSSRLLAGYKYQYKFYNNTLPNPPSCVSCSVGSKIWPGIEIANRRYDTTETNFLHTKYNPDGDGLPGGDISFLSWTNYTHNNVFP